MKAEERLAIESRIAPLLASGAWSQAATEALRGYGPSIFTFLRGTLRDEVAADDVFGHFSEQLWMKLPQFRGEAMVWTWMYRLAWTAAKDHQRRRGRRREEFVTSDAFSSLVADIRQSTAIHLRTQTKERFAELRARLDEEERSLLILRVERALSWKEIAEILSEGEEPRSEASLRKQFERLRAKLRVLAKELGLRED